MKQSKNIIRKLSICVRTVLIGWLMLCGASSNALARIVNYAGENQTIESNTKFNNAYESNETDDGFDYGVAVYNSYGQNMTVGDNVTFVGNIGEHFAGGALANNGDIMIGDNVQFINNQTILGKVNDQISNGGAFHNDASGTAVVGDGALFDGNFASRNGGAIYNTGGAELTIGSNATFSNNSVAEGAGGAIANNDSSGASTVTIGDGATFDGNSANWYGGAITNLGRMDFLGHAAFTNNAANIVGGAIFNESTGIITFNDVAFSGNSANGALNDIYNLGQLNFNGDVIMDGGIAGDGSIDFNNVNLTARISESGTISAGEINITDSTISNIILGNDFSETMYLFDSENVSGDFDGSALADNTLFEIEYLGAGEFSVLQKSTADITATIDSDENQTNAIVGLVSGSAENDNFNTAANTVLELLQNSDETVRDYGLKLATAMIPSDKPNDQHIAQSNSSQVFGAVGTRLSNGVSLGQSSGDFQIGKSAIWIQGLMNGSKLKDAFDTSSFGIAAGLETNISTDVKLGLGYARTDTTVNPQLGQVKIASNTIMAYGEYKPSEWFINAIGSYTMAKNDADLVIRTAEYNTNTVAAQLIGGYDMGGNIGMKFAPMAGLRYLNVKTDEYTGSLGGITAASTSSFITGIAGAKLSYAFNIGYNTTLLPELYIGATYDIKTSDVNASMVMANSAVVDVTGNALAKLAYEAGIGFNVFDMGALDISLNYIGRFRTDYIDNTGMLNLKYKF